MQSLAFLISSVVVAFFTLTNSASARTQKLVYITNENNTVSVIDSTNAVIATIHLSGQGPTGIAVKGDGTRAYVTNLSDSSLSIIDTTTNTETTNLALGTGVSPYGIAIAPDGQHLYLANENGTVMVFDTATNSMLGAPIPMAGFSGIVVTPDGKQVYTDGTNRSVAVIDAVTRAVSYVPSGLGPSGFAVTPDGHRVYVANAGNGAGTVTVIDTSTNSGITTIPVNGELDAIAITADGSHAYVSDYFHSRVKVIDTVTNTVIGSPISVGNAPLGIASSLDGFIYVANQQDGTVTVIDSATNTVVGSPISLGAGSGPIAFGQSVFPTDTIFGTGFDY